MPEKQDDGPRRGRPVVSRGATPVPPKSASRAQWQKSPAYWGRPADERVDISRNACRGRGGLAAAPRVKAAVSGAERRGHMGESAYAHVPVMAARIAALLLPALTSPAPGGRPPVLIDATLGRAGHARAFLEAVPGLQLIGIDADAAAIEAGRALAERYPGQVTVAHAFYDEIAEIAAEAGHRRVQGVLF